MNSDEIQTALVISIERLYNLCSTVKFESLVS